MTVYLLCNAAFEQDYFKQDRINQNSLSHEYLLNGLAGKHRLEKKKLVSNYDGSYLRDKIQLSFKGNDKMMMSLISIDVFHMEDNEKCENLDDNGLSNFQVKRVKYCKH